MAAMRSLALKMFVRISLLLLSLGLSQPGFAATEATNVAADRLMATEASAFDPLLPRGRFEACFNDLLPSGSGRFVEIVDCAGEGESGNRAGACLSIEVDIHSRNHTMRLLFDAESLAFRGGRIFSPDLEGVLKVSVLSKLPTQLKRGLRLWPLTCPPGSRLKMREEYAGLYEWCEDGQGRKQGPYRSWFSTGL